MVVVTPRIFSRSPLFQRETDQMAVYRFPYPSGDQLLIHSKKIPYFRMVFYLISGLYTAWRVACSGRCDLIHAHWVVPTGLIGVFLGKLTGRRVLVHARGTDMHTYANYGRLLRLITRWVLANADGLIATSEEIKTVMVRDFGIPSRKVYVIPTGIDPEKFLPLPENEIDGLASKNGREEIIYVGAISSGKGIEDLMGAAKDFLPAYPKAFLTLVGEGPLLKEIKEQLPALGFEKRIRLMGAVPPARIPKLLQSADIFVFPSLREGTPNALLEAMACGLPCVATRVGQIPAIIQDGKDGLLVNPGMPEELIPKIRLLLDDGALCRKIGQNGRNKAVQYSQNKSNQQIADIYRRLGVRSRGIEGVSEQESQ